MFIYSDLTKAPDMHLYTDASSIGFGGYFCDQWFSEKWPRDLPNLPDQEELYPIVVAAIIWDPSWSSKRIRFMCDNVTTKCSINKGRSSCTYIMPLMRQLTWCAVKHNFVFSASYITSLVNSVADSLSRLQMGRFLKLAPTASLLPFACPSHCNVIWNSAMFSTS